MIESIRLKNFRKHEDLSLNLDPKFNLIYGRNNSGKSTIFYAIEYCLFGNVQSFKKISQLAKFKQNATGVEMIFKGKTGDRYKLQRMHKLTGKTRSAKGSYTLKKFSGDGEAYVISSDFGDREEDLSLKVKEILGISKRFFETGVHFYQGTIPQILIGEKKLDIVFGIATATALSDVFKERALEFEKEIKNINTLEATLAQSKSEKAEYQKKMDSQEQKQKGIDDDIVAKEDELNQFKAFKISSETISKSVQSFENQTRAMENVKLQEDIIRKEIEGNKEKFGTKEELDEKYTAVKKNLDDSIKNLETQEKKIDEIQKQIRDVENQKIETETTIKQNKDVSDELQSFVEKVGEKSKLSADLKKNKTYLEKLSKNIASKEEDLTKIQEFFRTIERNKGDVEGILKRREQVKDKPKCEYCGAPIDSAKAAKEVKEFKAKLNSIDTEIKSNEEKEIEIKQTLVKLRNDLQENQKLFAEMESNIQKITELELRTQKSFGENLDKKVSELTLAVETQENFLEVEKKQLNNEREKEKELNKEFHEIEMNLKRMEELDVKLKKFLNEISATEVSFKKEKDSLVENFKNVKEQLKTRTKDLTAKEGEIQAVFLNTLASIVEKMESLEKEFSLENAILVKDQLKELIIAKISEISTTLDNFNSQKYQILEEIKETKNHIMRLDKQIANIEKDIQILRRKEEFSKRYRKYQDIFRQTQEIIRTNASKVLEDEILKLHKFLSSDDEFEKIHIDSEDYSLSVTPKGMSIEEYYPAWVYEGGGHKLILGLSYRFSLGKVIGNAPFLLVDEPTEYMDQNNRLNLLTKLSSTAENSQVILITHHDVDKIQCDKKIEIKK